MVPDNLLEDEEEILFYSQGVPMAVIHTKSFSGTNFEEDE